MIGVRQYNTGTFIEELDLRLRQLIEEYVFELYEMEQKCGVYTRVVHSSIHTELYRMINTYGDYINNESLNLDWTRTYKTSLRTCIRFSISNRPYWNIKLVFDDPNINDNNFIKNK